MNVFNGYQSQLGTVEMTTNDITVDGSIDITGNTTMDKSLNVNGQTTLNGGLNIPNGVDGQVLTSDDVGNATWKEIPEKPITLEGDVINRSNANIVNTLANGTIAISDITLNTAEQTLTSKTITLPIISEIKNIGTLTLPTSTDTLIGRDTVDTMTSKTITGPTNNVDANNLRNGENWVIPLSGSSPSSDQVLTYDGSNAIWKNPTANGTAYGTPNTLAKRRDDASCDFGKLNCTGINTLGWFQKNGTDVLLFDLDKYNIFCGDTVGGGSSSTGRFNVLIGSHAGEPLTSGENNTGVGLSSLWHITEGHDNTAVGVSALSSITTGIGCVAIGSQTGVSTNTSSFCTFLGTGANIIYDTNYDASLTYSTAVGADSVITKDNQVVLGHANLQEVFTNGQIVCPSVNVSGSYKLNGVDMVRNWGDFTNTFVGEGTWAWKTITGGANNTSVGIRNATNFTSGSNNTILGAWAGQNLENGNELTAIGMGALQSCISAGSNTACGAYALVNLTTGTWCTSIGRHSGDSHTTGDHCTYLGESARTNDGTLSNSTAVGANAIISKSNQIVLGNDSVSEVRTTGNILCGGITLNANKHFRAIGNQISYQYGTGCRNPPDHDIPDQPYPVEGNDTCGRIIVKTYNPTSNSFIVRVIFNTPYSSPPIIVFSPANAVAAFHINMVYMDSYNTGFDFRIRSDTLSNDTQYIWNYQIMEVV